MIRAFVARGSMVSAGSRTMFPTECFTRRDAERANFWLIVSLKFCGADTASISSAAEGGHSISFQSTSVSTARLRANVLVCWTLWSFGRCVACTAATKLSAAGKFERRAQENEERRPYRRRRSGTSSSICVMFHSCCLAYLKCLHEDPAEPRGWQDQVGGVLRRASSRPYSQAAKLSDSVGECKENPCSLSEHI